MKSLIIDKQDEILQYKDKKIKTSKHTIPLKLIDVIVINENIKISPKDILNITNFNIPIIFISKDNRKFSITLPLSIKNASLKISQYNVLKNRLDIAKNILIRKIQSHIDSLDTLNLVDFVLKDEIQNIKNAKNLDELLGIEGAFATKYFKTYFSLFDKRLSKGKRTKNPPLDPVNAMLSFLYTYGYYLITAKIFIKGFDPYISYLHTPFRNHYALSSDILEPIRADINVFVAKLFLEKELSIDDFTKKNGVYLRYQSRIKLWKKIQKFFNQINIKINKEIILLKKDILSKKS